MRPEPTPIGHLLDEAIAAVNTGDLRTAHSLAELVLREDAENREASELLAAEGTANGELRRLTILCCDLVGSTELSERQDPERYRTLVSGYRRLARDIIHDRYEGHIVSLKGDGFLTLFGYPTAHEDDTLRAVRTGLELCESVRRLSGRAQRAIGETLAIRVGIHRGLVFVDTDEDDVYGLAANLASRVEALAEPGTVLITDEVRQQVADRIEVVEGPVQSVKGVSEPVRPFTVLAQRPERDRSFTTPLIARAHELAALRSAWAAVRDGVDAVPTSILVRGEPGVGKSRLAAALVDEARGDGAMVLELTGSPFHERAGFHPIQVFLEARCGIERDMDPPERLERLRTTLRAGGTDPDTTVPWLAPVLGLPPAAGYEPVAAEGRKLSDEITEVVFEHLVQSFGTGPGLLLVEDLQWFDESTLHLLELMTRRGPRSVLMLITSRGGPQFPVGTILEPQPLGPQDRLCMLDALDTEGVPADVRRSMAERSDGIPLYLEELVRGWSPTTPPSAIGALDEAVPDALYEPLVARLLSTDAGIAVASAAATIGRDVDRALLADVVDIDDDELDRELEALLAGSVLRPSGRRDDEYRFRHELLREVAYELQPPAARRRVHERVAELLVVGADSPEMVDWNVAANHYELAARPADAAGAYARAADRARRRGALTEAREQLGHSIELIADLPEDGQRMADEVGYRLRRGFLAMSAEGAGSAEAASDYARCLELAMTDAQSDEMFSSLISLWAYHLSRAELGHARDVLEALRPGLAGPREWWIPANQAGFGMIKWFEGEFVDAIEILEGAARGLVDQRGESDVDEVWFVPNDPTASIHVHLALARFVRGDLAGADAAMADSLAVVDGLDFPQGPWSRAYGAWLRAWMATERAAFDAADAEAGELLGLATSHGFDSWAMIAVTQQTAIALTRAVVAGSDDVGVHAAALAGMVELWEAVELLVLLPYYITLVGAAFAAAGDTDSARAQYDRATALAEATGMRFYAAETARRRAHLTGDRESVVAGLLDARTIARAQGATLFEGRADADLRALGVERAPSG